MIPIGKRKNSPPQGSLPAKPQERGSAKITAFQGLGQLLFVFLQRLKQSPLLVCRRSITLPARRLPLSSGPQIYLGACVSFPPMWHAQETCTRHYDYDTLKKSECVSYKRYVETGEIFTGLPCSPSVYQRLWRKLHQGCAVSAWHIPEGKNDQGVKKRLPVLNGRSMSGNNQGIP